jgi:sterol desaturase/sphingolipid hydroxylase (fatty acid hydroxylase superfamily)
VPIIPAVSTAPVDPRSRPSSSGGDHPADPPSAPAAAAPRTGAIGRLRAALGELASLLRGHGPIDHDPGIATGAIALFLAVLSLLAVLAFRFPGWLTTPLLREVYDVDVLRALLSTALLVAGTLAICDLVAGRRRPLAGAALAVVALALAAGGPWVPAGPVAPGTPYLGIDYFVLDLLKSSAVFVTLERLFPLYREQPVFREAWQTDLAWFALNHAGVGALLLVVNAIAHAGAGAIGWAPLQAVTAALPMPVAVLACLVVADLVQYAVHRACHELPWLWRFHAIHHSVRTMDWLAGSRLHVVEVVVTRSAVLAVLLAAGFDKAAMDVAIVAIGVQAVFVHSNLRLRLGPLEALWATPRWHHWHHASDAVALDRNYAVNFPWIDRLFGTAVPASAGECPRAYGLHGETVPDGLVAQLRHPFARRD